MARTQTTQVKSVRNAIVQPRPLDLARALGRLEAWAFERAKDIEQRGRRTAALAGALFDLSGVAYRAQAELRPLLQDPAAPGLRQAMRDGIRIMAEGIQQGFPAAQG